MKKLVLTFAIMAVAAFAQEQAYKFPGWDCKNVTLLEEQLTLAPNDYSRIVITYHIDFARNGAPEMFTEACTRIDAAIDAVNPNYVGRAGLKKQFALCTNRFFSELVTYCMANPCSYDIHVALYDKTDWGWDVVSENLVKYTLSPETLMQAISYLNTQAIALDKPNQQVFKLLSSLNKKYTALLIQDKEKWSDVIAHIRTMMEVYKY